MRARIAVVLASMIGAVSVANAQEEASPLAKLSVHGYLSQAYAFTDGNQFLGIPDDGTADYRALALQFRYDVTSADGVIIQLSHESLGKSPAEEHMEDIELDWGFYEHRFRTGTGVKVGRVQMPFGIYNEIRDVGTLLPFYRPDSDYYGEGSFSTETVDGVVVSQLWDLGEWSLDADLYLGNSELLIPDGDEVDRLNVEDIVGAQLWLATPIEGLRFGLGANHMVAENLLAEDSEDDLDQWHASFEASFERVQVRGEYRDVDFEGGYYRAYYGQIGVPITDQLSANVQGSKVDFALSMPFLGQISGDLDEDLALGLNFKFRYDVVLKAEYHWNEGHLVDGLVFDGFPDAPYETEYAIVSLSTAF